MGNRGSSFLLGLVLAVVFAGFAGAVDPAGGDQPPPLPPGLLGLDAGQAVAAIDGQTLRLSDGRAVRLAGIMAPRPPLGWQAGKRWRRSVEAADALGAMAADREILLYGRGKALGVDRHDRLLAQVTRDDGLWLQGALLAAGLVRVHTAAADAEIATALYAAEHTARLAGRGIWADPYYEVRCASEMDNATDAVRVVQGRILAVADINGALYLNFGADWRRDFTIRVERRDRRRLGWREKPLMLEGAELEGALVEVRGWVYWFNGPAMDLDHGARLRLLAADSPLAIPACYQGRARLLPE